MNPPADFNADTWLARSLAARSAKALSALTRAELRAALAEARARMEQPLETIRAASCLDHASKLQRAGYALGEPFRPEQPEPPMPSGHELAAGRAEGGLRSGEEAGADPVGPCQEPHCGYYVCPRGCACGSDETCRQCGHRLHDGEETFGLAGLPSAQLRGGRSQNDTRRETGRPALPLVSWNRPEKENQCQR